MSTTAYLFKFACGTSTWTYTSGSTSITVGADTYTPLAIDPGDMDMSLGKGECKITMPFDVEPASLFALFNPPGVVWVTITRYPEMQITFLGKVTTCAPKLSSGKSELKCLSFQTCLAGDIPNKSYSVTCPYQIFDDDCAVSTSAYTLTLLNADYSMPDTMTIVAAIADTYPDGYFTGGMVVSGMEASFCISHVGDTLQLIYPLQTIGEQTYITIAPGCDGLVTTCRAKFSNEVNFGGCPFIPNTNLTTQGW